MALFITCRKNWLDTVWAKEKIPLLTDEAVRKKIPYYFFFSPEELRRYASVYENERSCILLLTEKGEAGMDLAALSRQLHLPVIVFAHHFDENPFAGFSCVMTKLDDSMEQVISLLRSRGCRYPAIVGMISTGDQDRVRIEQFKKADPSGRGLVFDTKSGRLIESLERLFLCEEPIDSIICSNDMQAVRLIRLFDMIDPGWNRKMLLVSGGKTRLGEYTSPSITTRVRVHDAGSRHVFRIYRMLVSDPEVSSIRMIIREQLIERESTAAADPCGLVFSQCAIPPRERVMEIIEEGFFAEKLEILLADADGTDLAILSGLIKGMPRALIAQTAFCSESTIKYRLRQYKEITGCRGTKEFTGLLRIYLDAVKLHAPG